jgi:uncharacterized protein HemX
MKKYSIYFLTGLIFSVGLSDAMACATCFGKSDSKMAAGMNMGIMTLLLVVLAIWIGLGAFAYYLLRQKVKTEADSSRNLKADTASLSASMNENDLVNNYQ